ncbi:hypothetical protein SISSUDRAFT_1035655 [Sistotremastrum suecicum HHB10207 ss-3]|uniref:Snurportin-1 n=1 Tax=Sistotremastrum suecicum HHB10207 ss-3 TaxID=1314776 RepID=A0A166AGI0_9AGAM|nr:hypothetical protein SISSUDRAFT_1035655 [Sistotremastrum suecicum HHB10207 ss-3]
MSTMHPPSRRESFKTPPISGEQSQQSRRQKALEEQKRKRERRVEGSRHHIDLFSKLSLGPDPLSEDEDGEVEIVREGVAGMASMLPPAVPEASMEVETTDAQSVGSTSTKRKKNRKKKKSNQYADRCMYAELLEMNGMDLQTMSDNGIPDDLQVNWIALAPVPRGKRCLALTHSSAGNPGTVPTTLHSRVRGSTFLTFPSPLPPDSILDCILDVCWHDNGILHILDVIRWHGQDIGDSEANFRFWWRDARLQEMKPVIPPAPSQPSDNKFTYPTNFLPIPYYIPLPFQDFLQRVIPLARASRVVNIRVPNIVPTPGDDGADMDLDLPRDRLDEMSCESDGLLLYDAQASYESGTTPLSLWVPAKPLDGEYESRLDILERILIAAQTPTAV